MLKKKLLKKLFIKYQDNITSIHSLNIFKTKQAVHDSVKGEVSNNLK